MSTPTFDKVSRDPAFQELFVRAHRRVLPKNRVVLAEGAKPSCLYFILSGTVSVRLANREDRDVLLAYMHAGDFFGEMCLFPDVKARSAEVRTVSECAVLEIGYDVFVSLATRHPSLWLELAGQLAARLRSTNRRLADLPVQPAAERIWSVITELARRSEAPRNGAGISLRITRSDLGKLAGCSREVAGNVLHDLREQGRVALDGHRIVVREGALRDSSPG
jgi:CRP/FNR family transcriptional regulator, cyclic AMP receptor protein